MGKFRIRRQPTAALLALAFPLVAAGAFALGSGYDLSPQTETSTSTSNSNSTAAAAGAAEGKPVDPLATSRKNLQQAGLPISLLSGGISQLTDGGKQLNDGVGQLSEGITQAHDGTVQLADGFGQYRDGIGQLGDGASQISGGVDQLVDQLAGFGAQQSEFTASLEATAQEIDRFPHPGSDAISGKIRSVIDTLNTQGFGPATLDQLQTLKGGARQLSGELNDPSGQFLTATGQLGDATVQLRDGLGQLDDGGIQLRAGTDQLVTAVGPVSGIVNGIQTNVQDASAGLPKATELTAKSNPPEAGVSAASAGSSTAPVAPYLIAALLAVGAIGAVSLVRALSRGSRFRWVAAIVATLAVGVSAALAFAFTTTGAGIAALLGAGLFLVVSAAAYLAAAGAIQRLLGAAVGQTVNLALLLVQVLVCGAAYASNAAIWGQLSAFMPMAYTAAGAREIGYGAMTSTGWLAIVLTAALLLVSGLVLKSQASAEPSAASLDGA